MSDVNIGDERVIGYAEWNEREAKNLRLYRADSPSMPELAEMHEETADALRTLLRERARMREALLAAKEWHEAEDKALSKQPAGGDRAWRRIQHQQQCDDIRAALKETGYE